MTSTRTETTSHIGFRGVLGLSMLGACAVSYMAGCSSDPATSSPRYNMAGAPSAGAPSAGAGPVSGAGAFAAGGTAFGGSGGSGGDVGALAGAPGGGMDTGGGGSDTGGTGGDTSAGTGGMGGAPVSTMPITFSFDGILWVSSGTASGAATGTYCSTAPAANQATLPYITTTGFIPSGYDGPAPKQITQADCADRPSLPGGPCAKDNCGNCNTFTYTPDATSPTFAGVRYQRMFDDKFTHAQVCLPSDVSAVNFWAKGAKGGEKVTVTAQGGPEVPLTLTAAWAQYSIPMAGVVYDTDASGVELGFYWKVVPGQN